MLVKIEDLKMGDEIIISSGGKLLWTKLLRDPSIRYEKDANGNKIPMIYNGKSYYKSVKGSVKVIHHTKTNPSTNFTWNWNEYILSPPEEHNGEKYIDLNYKDIWLVKNS